MAVDEALTVAVVGGSGLLRASLAMLLEARGWRCQEWPWPEPGAEREVTGERLSLAVVDLVGATRPQRAVVTALADAGCPVVVIAPNGSAPMMGRCIELGASAAVSAGDSFDTLLDALESRAAGRPYWSDAERAGLLREWRAVADQGQAVRVRFDRLTPREAAVLTRIMRGENADRIARQAALSQATVRSHIKALLRKLEVNSQLEAVALAVRSGWEPPPQIASGSPATD